MTPRDLGEPFMNGAPGSSSAVRADQAGANSSKVVRPSRIAWQAPKMPAMAVPIFGVKRILEAPAGIVDDAVQGNELMYPDGTHDRLLEGVSARRAPIVVMLRRRRIHRTHRVG